MAWLAKDLDGTEAIYAKKPLRGIEMWQERPFKSNRVNHTENLPIGTIFRLIGRELSWQDEPVELTEQTLKKTKVFNLGIDDVLIPLRESISSPTANSDQVIDEFGVLSVSQEYAESLSMHENGFEADMKNPYLEIEEAYSKIDELQSEIERLKTLVKPVTDEEIEAEAERRYPYRKHWVDYQNGMHEGFIEGIEWYQEQQKHKP